MLVACRLAGLSALRRIMQGSERARNAGGRGPFANGDCVRGHRLALGRVEEGRGGLGHAAAPRFPSPLIKPDVRISRIRLSDRLRGRPTATTNRRRLRLAVELAR